MTAELQGASDAKQTFEKCSAASRQITGCGANCAFMTLPAQLAATARPVLTGWLADPLVLSPGSSGISFGSQVKRGGVGVEREEVRDCKAEAERVVMQPCWQEHRRLGPQR